MPIWSAEIKELERLHESFKGQLHDLEKELERLIKADDENMILLYSRRCLEVIITDLCECELNRERGTEPLKGIIDKLKKERQVPSNIITSMDHLNSLSTYGTHPKDFDLEQVKPVLNNLDIIIKWYLKYKDAKAISRQKAEEVKDEITAPEDITEQNRKPKKRLILILSGLTLIVVIVVAALFVFNIIGGEKRIKELEKSIAVLPFINDSPDSTNLYFCNGMMEDILDNLVKIEDLNVKSRTDVEPYRATSKSLKDIGRELGVANILEGSVRKQGNRFKISVQLIFAETGFHLWSDTYEGEYSEEIFSVTSNLAQKIATALKAIITRKEKETIERVPTTDLIAYDLFIRAKYEVEKYWDNHDRKHMLEAQRLLDRAIEIDPGFEKAIREKAFGYLGLNKYDSLIIYANKLLSIDPKSGDGYFMKGEAYRFAQEPDSAINNYLMAIKYLSKDNIEDRKWSEFCIGNVFCYQRNDYRNGLQWLQKGLYLKEDKSDWGKYEMLGWLFSNIGDYEKSDKYFKMSLEHEVAGVNIRFYSLSLIGQSKFNEALNFLDTICQQPENLTPCSQMRFYIHVLRKEFELAEQFHTQFLTTGGTSNVGDSIFIAYVYNETGKEQESLTILKNCQISLEKKLDKSPTSSLFFNLSLLQAILDQKEEANKYLSKAIDLNPINRLHDLLEICPIFENLWDDPVFKALVKRAQEEKAAIRAQVGEMEKRGEIDDLLSLISIK